MNITFFWRTWGSMNWATEDGLKFGMVTTPLLDWTTRVDLWLGPLLLGPWATSLTGTVSVWLRPFTLIAMPAMDPSQFNYSWAWGWRGWPSTNFQTFQTQAQPCLTFNFVVPDSSIGLFENWLFKIFLINFDKNLFIFIFYLLWTINCF